MAGVTAKLAVPSVPRKVEFTVYQTPPSVNMYVRHSNGMHYLSKEAKAFKKEAERKAGAACFLEGPLEGKRFRAEILCYFKNLVGPDVDNLAKMVLDGAKDAGLIPDDRYVIRLLIEKIVDPKLAPRTVTRLYEYPEVLPQMDLF